MSYVAVLDYENENHIFIDWKRIHINFGLIDVCL